MITTRTPFLHAISYSRVHNIRIRLRPLLNPSRKQTALVLSPEVPGKERKGKKKKQIPKRTIVSHYDNTTT